MAWGAEMVQMLLNKFECQVTNFVITFTPHQLTATAVSTKPKKLAALWIVVWVCSVLLA